MTAWFDGVDITVEVAFATAPLADTPTWTDITAYVRSVDTDAGRSSEYTDFSPRSLSLTLDNNDRRFDPEYGSSPYSPNVLPMKRIRVRCSAGGYYTFATNDYMTAPDEASLDLTGDLDVIWRAGKAGWSGGTGETFVAKGRFASFEVYNYLSNFYLRIEGTNQGVCSVADLGITGGTVYWFRVTRNAATGAVDWYVQPDSGTVPSSWGSAKTDSGTQASGAMTASTQPLSVGAVNTGVAFGSFLNGDMYDVIVKDGIGGAVVFEWLGVNSVTTSTSASTLVGPDLAVDGATLNSTTYPLFDGFVLGWPQRVRGFTDETVRVDAIDGSRFLENAVLSGCAFSNEVVNDGAIHYWPLQETPDDGSLLIDEIGSDSDLSIQPVSPLTGGTPFPLVSGDFGTADLGFPIGRSSAPLLRVYNLGLSSWITDYLVGPPKDSTVGYGLEFWARITATGTDQVTIEYSPDATNRILITVDDTVAVTFIDTVADVQHQGQIYDGAFSGVHHYAVWCDGSDVILYVDGVEVGREAVTTVSAPVSQLELLYVAQQMDSASAEDVNVSHIAVYPNGTEPDWLTHFLAGSIAYGHPYGERSGARVGRVLDEIGWPTGLRELSTGDTVHGPYNPGAVSALSYMRSVATAEEGLLFIDAAGKVTLRDRNWQWSQSSSATFSDDGDAAACVFSDIVVDANTVDALRNEVTVSYDGGSVSSSDATSITAYGPSRDSVSIPTVESQVTASNLADYRLRTRKDPRTIISSIEAKPRSLPAVMFPKVLDIDIGDVITVERTPAGTGSQVAKTVVVQGVSHSVDAGGGWVTRYYLSPALESATSVPYFIVGDATYGRLGVAAGNKIPF